MHGGAVTAIAPLIRSEHIRCRTGAGLNFLGFHLDEPDGVDRSGFKTPRLKVDMIGGNDRRATSWAKSPVVGATQAH